ncbi:MAG: hypothetical protein MJ217_01795 [Bacilli bacterium]|nr:hypothetical protein [Bacilli bacterium]
MTKSEFNNLINKLRDQNLTDEEIMNILFESFQTGVCSLEDLEKMVEWFGYSLTDEFYKENGIER